MASSCREAVKVVLIDTQYVVTDPMSFKSVVQSLTGKDSCVSWIEESSFATAGAKRKRSEEADKNGGSVGTNSATNGYCGGGVDWKLTKGLSFKDLDRMILEMPPMEDLYQLWSPNNLLDLT